tara:strand:- start:2056 stop:2277 length:222 start_codon:yes stop_codon:yes gene_type:complete
MDFVREFLLEELEGAYDLEYQDKMRFLLECIDTFIEECYEEVKEDILSNGEVVELSQYEELRNEFNNYKTKYS